MNLFIPAMYQKSIFEIDYQKLKKQGYQILIFDLDNTIGSIKESICSSASATLLTNLEKHFTIIIASNSTKKRVAPFLKNLNFNYYTLSLKPLKRVIKKIQKTYHVPYQKMVIIGDQILTDVLLGNRCKALTILVDPIMNIDFKVTAINRYIEKIIMKKNKIIRGKYYEKK